MCGGEGFGGEVVAVAEPAQGSGDVEGVGGGFCDGVCVFWGVHVGPAVFGLPEDEVGCDGVFLEGPGGEGGYFLSFAVVEFELVGVEVAFGGGFCGGVGVGVDGGDGGGDAASGPGAVGDGSVGVDAEVAGGTGGNAEIFCRAAGHHEVVHKGELLFVNTLIICIYCFCYSKY